MRKTALIALVLSTLFASFAAAAELPVCAAPKNVRSEPTQLGNPKARFAAQRGLEFLERETVAWQNANKCYGCHTQGVTLEALSVGFHNQYKIDKSSMKAIVDTMLNGSGGARRNKGFSHLEVHFFGTAKAFGGNAFARYDKWVGQDLTHDLLKVAGELVEYQKDDGSVDSDYPVTLPVAIGVVQRTYQAAQTWRQAHARSADDRWLLPISKAERYLQATARTWMQQPPQNIQELNYGLLGLQAAGVSTSEPVMRALSKRVLSLQNHDGGWGYSGDASNALATGETVYTLRMLGLTDRDPSVARGTGWLVSHQQQDGGWSNVGSSKAEAMWAVLGLVAVDVLTVSIDGLEDGQHVDGSLAISSEARDNSGAQGGGVTQLELAIDDVPVKRVCGAQLSHTWDTSKLESGKHIVDLTATNAKGQISSRRFEVYAGNVFMTQIGSRSAENGTVVSLRNIAPKAGGTVELQILKPDGQGAPIATLSQGGQPGPMTFTWDGKAKGKPAAAGKYLARVVYKDADKKAVQSEDQVVVLDTIANQENGYGQIQGHIALPKSAAAPAAAPAPVAANAQVDLVDGAGRVVQSVKTTSEGNYRFKNVDQGKYKVRFHKSGFAAPEQEVRASKGAESAADAYMH
jgi:squalene-hopene/tetraprenyl-beta-curcumene cyclase